MTFLIYCDKISRHSLRSPSFQFILRRIQTFIQNTSENGPSLDASGREVESRLEMFFYFFVLLIPKVPKEFRGEKLGLFSSVDSVFMDLKQFRP
jgi:hypothetical protein